MKIIIAPDSFKESLSSMEAALQIEAGIRTVFPQADCLKLPLADGGEGTVDALIAATFGHKVSARVTGPLGDPCESFFGVCGDGQTAVIEMSAANGLNLVPRAMRNPLLTTSYGTGELILAALDTGLRNLIIGIGGSATNDAGAGMLQALGVRLLDERGQEIAAGGGSLKRLARIDVAGLDPRLRDCRVQVACDVDNPLTGPNGASAVYGPQKGASLAMVAELDRCLVRFAELLRRDLGQDISAHPGAGAAGGMGAALLAFLGAELRPGVDIVLEATHFEQLLAGTDLIITGEGRIDGQSVFGKAPVGIARVAARHGVPVIGLAGSLGPGAEAVLAHGISALFSVVSGPGTLEDALAGAAENIRRTSRQIAEVLRLGGQFKSNRGEAAQSTAAQAADLCRDSGQ
jgi:glycerate kinase